MGICTSNNRDKTIKIDKNIMEKSAILGFYMNETNKDILSTENDQKLTNNSQYKNNNDKSINSKNNFNNSTRLKNTKTNFNNYYLICPNCSIRSPHIEKLIYDNKSKDFLIKYTCICDKKLKTKAITLTNILSNKEPLNECNIHLNNKLIDYCKTCKRAICSKCKEGQHNNHVLEIDIIDKPISKEDANSLLKKIKEKEELFNNEIYKSEEKIENGIDNKIQKLNEEKINYKKQLKKYKENSLKTFSFLKNLYLRYINIFNDENEFKNNLNNEFNNDIMLTNHIHNFAIKRNDINKFDTNIDEIINIYDNNNKLDLNINYGFPNKNEFSSDINDQKEKNFDCTKIFKGHTDKIVSLIELSSGQIASGSYDRTIRIWNLNSQKEEIIINEKGRVFCLLEFKKNKILSGTGDNSIILWDIELPNSDYIHNFKGHELWVNSLVKCDENHFASASNDTKIKIWDFYNQKCIATLSGHLDCVLTLILLKNKNLCSGGADLSIKIWDWEEKICLSTLKGHEKWVKCLYELHNGIILSGSDDNTIKLWENFINIKTLKKHTHSVRTFCQINKNYFASGSFDCTIKIWEISKWICLKTLVGHNSNIINLISLKYNNSHYKSIASCSNDRSIRIWDANI